MKKIQINNKTNHSLIYLNSKFYSQKSIIYSIKEFNNFINSKIKKLGKYYTLEIKNKTNNFSIEEITKELLNYIIGIEFQTTNQTNNQTKTK